MHVCDRSTLKGLVSRPAVIQTGILVLGRREIGNSGYRLLLKCLHKLPDAKHPSCIPASSPESSLGGQCPMEK